MAKLPSQKWDFASDAGDSLKFTSEITVNTHGMFSVTMPEEFRETAEGLMKAEGKVKYKVDRISSDNIKFRVYGYNLDDCKRFINAVSEDYFKCEQTTEKVIVYGTNMQVSYWVDGQGNLRPNGYKADGGQWGPGPLNATNYADYYSVGIAAKVMLKTTTVRRTSTKIKYEKAKDESFSDKSYLALLNAFVGLDMDDPIRDRSLKEMPYSEEAARFFYDMMIGLCSLARQIETFLSDEKNIIKSIENRRGLFLPFRDNDKAA